MPPIVAVEESLALSPRERRSQVARSPTWSPTESLAANRAGSCTMPTVDDDWLSLQERGGDTCRVTSRTLWMMVRREELPTERTTASRTGYGERSRDLHRARTGGDRSMNRESSPTP